ncbi:hypothetical protein RYX36_029155 [Vicia faba]
MRYYKDENREYNFLHTDGCLIYEDRIVNPPDEGLSLSCAGFLSSDVKAYFNEWLGNILADNQVQEECMMTHIEGVSNEREESQGEVEPSNSIPDPTSATPPPD